MTAIMAMKNTKSISPFKMPKKTQIKIPIATRNRESNIRCTSNLIAFFSSRISLSFHANRRQYCDEPPHDPIDQ